MYWPSLAAGCAAAVWVTADGVPYQILLCPEPRLSGLLMQPPEQNVAEPGGHVEQGTVAWPATGTRESAVLTWSPFVHRRGVWTHQ